MGELHLEIYMERLKREYGVEVGFGAPLVSYRETVTRRVCIIPLFAPVSVFLKKNSVPGKFRVSSQETDWWRWSVCQSDWVFGTVG